MAGCDFGVLDDPCLLLDQTRRGRVTCTPGPMGYFCGRNNAFLAACVVVDDRSCFRRGTAAGRVVATGRVAKYCVACWRQRQVCCTTKLPVGFWASRARRHRWPCFSASTWLCLLVSSSGVPFLKVLFDVARRLPPPEADACDPLADVSGCDGDQVCCRDRRVCVDRDDTVLYDPMACGENGDRFSSLLCT